MYLYYFLLFLLVDVEVVECMGVVITGQIVCSFSIISFLTIVNGATTYPGLHNHTAVRSKEYASPKAPRPQYIWKVPPPRLVDRSPTSLSFFG